MQLKRKDNKMTPEAAKQQGEAEALQALQVCVGSLKRSVEKLGTTMPPFTEVSSECVPLYRTYFPHWLSFLVDPGYEGNLSKLSVVTRDVVQDKLKNDAWLMWAIAQRVSLPVKINACIEYVASLFNHLLRSCSVFIHVAKGSAVGVGRCSSLSPC